MNETEVKVLPETAIKLHHMVLQAFMTHVNNFIWLPMLKFKIKDKLLAFLRLHLLCMIKI